MPDEAEYHVTAVRLRVTGGGNLLLTLSDLDSIQNINLLPLGMQIATRIEPTRLSNIQSQRIRLEGKTTEINEIFKINRILIFATPVYIEYPG